MRRDDEGFSDDDGDNDDDHNDEDGDEDDDDDDDDDEGDDDDGDDDDDDYANIMMPMRMMPIYSISHATDTWFLCHNGEIYLRMPAPLVWSS